MQLYVSNSDIANIEVGDPIKYNLAALPSNQYGLVDGVVTAVSSDGQARAKMFDAECPDEGRVRIHGEVVEN